MTIEEQLKATILNRYRSIAAFTTSIGIPNSTLNSVFKRGIANAGISTMIKVFNALDLDIESIQTGTLQKKSNLQKKSPSTDESALGEEEIAMFNKLLDILISMGAIREGEDITDLQAEVLAAVCRILNATFQ